MIDTQHGGREVTLETQLNQLSFIGVASLGVTVTTVFDYYAPGTDSLERQLFAMETTQGNLHGSQRAPFITTSYGRCRVLS